MEITKTLPRRSTVAESRFRLSVIGRIQCAHYAVGQEGDIVQIAADDTRGVVHRSSRIPLTVGKGDGNSDR